MAKFITLQFIFKDVDLNRIEKMFVSAFCGRPAEGCLKIIEWSFCFVSPVPQRLAERIQAGSHQKGSLQGVLPVDGGPLGHEKLMLDIWHYREEDTTVVTVRDAEENVYAWREMPRQFYVDIAKTTEPFINKLVQEDKEADPDDICAMFLSRVFFPDAYPEFDSGFDTENKSMAFIRQLPGGGGRGASSSIPDSLPEAFDGSG
jgi:hypothetical protein